MRTLSIIGIVFFGLMLLGGSAPENSDIAALQGVIALTTLYGLALCITYLVNHKKAVKNGSTSLYAELKELHLLKQDGVLEDAEYEARKAALLQK